MMKDKAIITAAVTGSIHTPTMSPYLPICEVRQILGRKGLDHVNF